jgi:O-antigen/teichoic acid export membrane protein
MNTSGRLVRGTVVFISAGALLRATPFLLLPFFARALTAAEFGQIGLIVTISTALATLVSLGLETAVFRGYLHRRENTDDLARFVNTVGAFAVSVPLLTSASVAVVAGPTLADAFDVPRPALLIGLIGASTNVSATVVPLAILRAQERLRAYITLTWAQVALSASLSVVFVLMLDWGVVGWMGASAITSAVLLARGLAMVGHRWTTDVDLRSLSAALRFGVPLVPHAFAHWGLAASDRAILAAFVPSADIGPYYVAFLVTLPINLVGIAMSQAAQPLFAEAFVSAKRRDDLGKFVTVQTLAVCMLGVTVALLGPPAIAMFLPAEFAAAGSYVPWLAAGACFFAVYLIPMNAVSVMAGKTRSVWVVTVAAATLNIGLNLVLIRDIGPLAAAINTSIGYLVLLLGLTAYARWVTGIHLPVDVRATARGVGLIAVAWAVGYALVAPTEALTLALRTGLVLATGLALITVGPLRNEARLAIRVIRPVMEGFGR